MQKKILNYINLSSITAPNIIVVFLSFMFLIWLTILKFFPSMGTIGFFYETAIFLVTFYIFMNTKIKDSINTDILKGNHFPSLAFLLGTLYSLIATSFCIVLLQKEIIYLFDLKFEYLSNNIPYFKTFNNLLWPDLNYKFEFTFIAVFMKIWIAGFLLIYTPFNAKGNPLNIKINKDNLFVLFFIIICMSAYDSFNVPSNDLMKSNYYFFKQSIIFCVFMFIICNFDEYLENKNYETVIKSTDTILVLAMLLIIQNIFSSYDIYLLDPILLFLVVSYRDLYKIKFNEHFLLMFFLLIFYEFIFYITYSNIIDKDLLTKTIAICISLILYFYKIFFVALYRCFQPPIIEKELFEIVKKRDFDKKFSKILKVSDKTVIRYSGKIGNQYYLDDLILINIQYPESHENNYIFDFEIMYIQDSNNDQYFNGELLRNIVMVRSLSNPAAKHLMVASGKKSIFKIHLHGIKNKTILDYLDNLERANQ